MTSDVPDFEEDVTQTTFLPTEESSSHELRTDIDEITIKDTTTTELPEMSTIQMFEYSTFKPVESASTIQQTEFPSDADAITMTKPSDVNESTVEQTTIMVTDSIQNFDTIHNFDPDQTQYEMIQLIENIVKNISDEKTNMTGLAQRKEDSTESVKKTSFVETNTDEIEFSDLGETNENHNTSSNAFAVKSAINKLNVPTLAPILNELKHKLVNAIKNTNAIALDPAPKQSLGLEESTANAQYDILEFTKICNELAFNFWIALNNEGGISSARSLILSPFALTSMLGKAILFIFLYIYKSFSFLVQIETFNSFDTHRK